MMRTTKVLNKFAANVRTNYLAISSILMIVITLLAVYWQDLSVLANEALQNEAVSHLILVPFLISYLLYRKKDTVRASLSLEKFQGRLSPVSLNEIIGSAICLSAFLLYWYGSFTFYPLEYHIASLIIFVSGMTLILFNAKTFTALIFPILFLIFLIPPPSNITYSAGALLGNFNAQASYTILKTLGIPVALSSSYGPPTIIINNPSGRPLEFAIDLACSGIYSLLAFTMFAAFLAYIAHGSIIKKIALFPLGFLTLQILNILRISLTGLVAYQFGEETAMTIFHVFSGWLLIFLGTLLLLLIAEKLIHLQIFGAQNKPDSCSECNNSSKNREAFCTTCGKFLKKSHTKISKRFWIKIFALLLASSIITLSIQAPTFAFAQGLTITSPNPETSVEAFPQVPNHQLKFLYRDQNFEKISRQDASLLYAYLSQNTSNPTVYVLVGVASSITNLHSWEVCLVALQTAQGLPPLATVLDSRDIQIMQNPPIIARYFMFQHPDNYTQVTLYWYQKALFKTGITIEPKYTRISLIILTTNPNESPKLEQKLVNMGQSIAAYWEPLKTRSLVSLGVPTMQVLLGSTILFAIFLQTTQYAREQRRKTTNLKIFEKLASPKEKLLYQTIKELSQKTKETTTQNIASAFEKATGKVAKLNELIDMLNSLEKNGIINADIINILDEPRLVWKP
jgi:exosortase